MDISGAQLNSAAISAYNSQLQASSQQNRQTETLPPAQPSNQEVSLSSEARNRATQDALTTPAPVATPPERQVAPTSEAQSGENKPAERSADQAQKTETRQQASQVAQTDTGTYAARQAVQSYFSISNF
jgi:hypothetical protein